MHAHENLASITAYLFRSRFYGDNEEIHPEELQDVLDCVIKLSKLWTNCTQAPLLLGDIVTDAKDFAEALALYGYVLRQSAKEGPGQEPARQLRRQLAMAFCDLFKQSSTTSACFELASRSALALVRGDSLSAYCVLLHSSAMSTAQAQRNEPRSRAGAVVAALSLLSEATLLLNAFSVLVTADAAAMAEVRTSLFASPFLDHVCQLVQQLAALPEARQQLAAQLARLGGALRTLHSHDTAAASIPMLPLQPCLSYVLSSHVVGLCCALDGEQQTYGLPAVLRSTEPPPDPEAAAAAAAWSWSSFAAAASAPLPLFTPEGRPFMGHCGEPDAGHRQSGASAPGQGPQVLSAQLALAALAVWADRALCIGNDDSSVESVYTMLVGIYGSAVEAKVRAAKEGSARASGASRRDEGDASGSAAEASGAPVDGADESRRPRNRDWRRKMWETCRLQADRDRHLCRLTDRLHTARQNQSAIRASQRHATEGTRRCRERLNYLERSAPGAHLIRLSTKHLSKACADKEIEVGAVEADLANAEQEFSEFQESTTLLAERFRQMLSPFVPPHGVRAVHALCMRLGRAALAAWRAGRLREGAAAAAAAQSADAAAPVAAALAPVSARAAYAEAPAGPTDAPCESEDVPSSPSAAATLLSADGFQTLAAPRASSAAEAPLPAPPPSPPPPLPPPPPRPVALLAAGEAPLVVHAALRCARAALLPLVVWSAQHDAITQTGSRREMPAPLAARLAEWWGLLLQAAEAAACGAGAGGSADAPADTVGRELLRWLGCCLAGNDCDEEGGGGAEDGGRGSGTDDEISSGSETGTASPAEPSDLAGCVPFPVRPSPDVSAALAAGWLPAVTRMLRRATTQMRAAAAGAGAGDAPAAPALLPLVGAHLMNPAGWEDAWTEVLAFSPSREDVLGLLDAAEELLRAAVEAAGGPQFASRDMACGAGGGIGGAAYWTEPRLQPLTDAVGMGMRLLDPSPSEWLQPGTEPGKAPDLAEDGPIDNATAGAPPSTKASSLPMSEAIPDHDGAAHGSGVSTGAQQLANVVGHAASRLLPAFSQAVLRLAACEGARVTGAAAGMAGSGSGTACGARPVGTCISVTDGAVPSAGDVGAEARDGGGGSSVCGDVPGRIGSGSRAGKGSGKAESAGCGGSGSGRGMRGGVDGDGKAGGGCWLDSLLLAAAIQALGWVPWLVKAAMAAIAAIAADGPASTASAAGDGDDALVRPDPAAVHLVNACGLLLAAPARWARLLFEDMDVIALLALLMRTLQRAEAASRHCGDSGRSLPPALVPSARLVACRALACLAAAFPDELRRAFGATAAESRSGVAANPAARAPLSWPAVASLLGPAGPLPQPELLAVLRRVVLEGGEVGDGEEARAAMEAAQLGNCMDLLRAGVHDSPTCWS